MLDEKEARARPPQWEAERELARRSMRRLPPPLVHAAGALLTELLDLVASGLDFDSSSAPGVIGIVVGGVAAVVTLAAVIILALWLSRSGCFKSNNKVEGPPPRAAAEEAAA